MTPYSELASFFVIIGINLILIGTPISAGTFIILRLTRAAAPRARYLLTLVAFFAAVVLPFVVTVAPPPETRPQLTLGESSSAGSETIPGEPASRDIRARQPEIFPQIERSSTSLHLFDDVVRFLSRPTLSMGLFTLWLIGACLLLGRETASHLRAAKARRQWIPASVEIRERLNWPGEKALFVDNKYGPCAVGVLSSVVVIPTRLFDELSLSAARQIARHELDHLKWRDPSVNAAMRIVRASLWPSAPLWYLAGAIRLEREAASDRAAINSISGGLRPDIAALDYAATLISVARRCAFVEPRPTHNWVATDIGNDSDLNDRVRRLMEISSRLTAPRLSLAFLALVISAISLAGLPVARLESKRQEDTDSQRAALSETTRAAETAKYQANKSASPSSLSNRTHVAAQDRLGSTPAPTPSDAVAEPVSSTPLALSEVTDTRSTIQPGADLQLELLKNQMAALGYKDLTAQQLSEMRAYAVGPHYVAEMADSGYSGLPADMLIQFKRLAVSSFYIREMRVLGYANLSPSTLVTFRQHGVSAEYIRQMRSRVSGSISAEQVASLRLYGTSIDFVDKLKQIGYGNLNAGQLISMRLQGVSVAFIENLQAQGRKGLSADELIAARMRGRN